MKQNRTTQGPDEVTPMTVDGALCGYSWWLETAKRKGKEATARKKKGVLPQNRRVDRREAQGIKRSQNLIDFHIRLALSPSLLLLSQLHDI